MLRLGAGVKAVRRRATAATAESHGLLRQAPRPLPLGADVDKALFVCIGNPPEGNTACAAAREAFVLFCYQGLDTRFNE